MIKLNETITDFEKISKDLKATNSKVNENDFIARLVICYENTDKEKNQVVYNDLIEYTKKLDLLTFNYKCKENKYFYLLNKNDFENIADFEKLQNLFCKKDKNDNIKPLTINLKNFNNCKNFLDLTLKLLQNKDK